MSAARSMIYFDAWVQFGNITAARSNLNCLHDLQAEQQAHVIRGNKSIEIE
jgi:hypothetical protein